MADLDPSIRGSIEEKKAALISLINKPMAALAVTCGKVWPDSQKINAALKEGFHTIPQCKLIYAWDRDNQVVSHMIEKESEDENWQGRDLSDRPYLTKNLPFRGMMLSSVYESKFDGHRCITALQAINPDNHLEGFIAVDFSLKELMMNTQLNIINSPYKQYRGDPAVRGTLFQQQRIQSDFDKVIDAALARLALLIIEYGVFHTKILFSSNRCTLWFYDDPYQYQLMDLDEYMDDDILLAYPERNYPARAKVSPAQVADVYALFKKLRYIDETIYLRSGSLNIINATVGLTFSCDGSHYMSVEEFLGRDVQFWLGLE